MDREELVFCQGKSPNCIGKARWWLWIKSKPRD